MLLGGLLLRGTIAAFLPPGFDEAYYYLYTQHLDWSYFDHPLLVALSTGLGPWLTGVVSQFTIRWGALLLYTGALLLVYRTSAHLFSRKAAIVTVAIASVAPIFFVGFGVLTLPDAPLMFFWTAGLYVAAIEFFPAAEPSQREAAYCPSYRLAVLGLLVGLACLAKYHGLALGFGLVGFCLTSRNHRKALRSPWMLASVGLFLLALLPIVIWNVQHDWISLRFQSGRAVPDRGYSLLDLLVTVLAGVGYLFPTIGVPLWWTSLRTLFSTPPASCSFLLWLSLPLMLTFTLMGGYRPILPTWAMPGFWSATLLLGHSAAQWQARTRRRWLWGTGLAVSSLLLVALLHVTNGIFQKPSQLALFGGFLSPSQDASTQLLDISQLRGEFATIAPQLRQADFVFTSDLFLAGQVGMAISPLTPIPITCFSHDLRGFAFWSTAESWVGRTGLYIGFDRPSQTVQAQYSDYFERIDKLGEIPIRRGGAIVQVLQVYRCQTLQKPYPRPY
nr:glycosyltransferase family 39 protein [Leptolyngbya sp. FACHB-36]